MTFLPIDLTKVDKPTEEQRSALSTMLDILAGRDFDGASLRNGVGFNREDSPLGHQLSEYSSLTDEDYKTARGMVYKYWRQLPAHLFKVVYRKYPTEAER